MAFGWILALIAHLVLAAWTSGHALINRPTPRSALLWITYSWLVPFLAPALYVVFGIDRIHRRALLKEETQDQLRRLFPSVGARRAAHRAFSGDHGPLNAIHRVARHLSQRALLSGNQFRLLRDGEEAYPAMLDDIASATSSVNLMTYIFDEDSLGAQFVEALAAAVGRGVPARVLYDAAGCVGTSNAFFNHARELGIAVEPFFPLNPLARRAQLNLRNHRKALVVDGRVGYFGGMNISAKHYARSDTVGRCHDLHVRAEGPVVQQLQEVFAEDWFYAVGEELLSPRHFPEIADRGQSVGRVITSGPDHEQGYLQLLLFSAIGAAQRTIRLVTPYFVPEEPLEFALRNAAMRGVDTQIFLPAETDHPTIKRAAYAVLPRLVKAGVKVFETPGPFVHAKAYLVDGEWALMGSPNFDPRSFALSYEVAVEMSETPLIENLEAWIDGVRERAITVTGEALANRPFRQRLGDHFWNLFGPLM